MITLYDNLPLELEDGRLLTESNAILFYLAQGTTYLPFDAWSQAQVMRWMFFEEDLIQNGLASLRHWTLTGKLARRSPEMISTSSIPIRWTLTHRENFLER